MNRWKFILFHPREDDEALREKFTGTAEQTMKKLARIKERRGWTVVAATDGPCVEEELNPQWHSRDLRNRTDARGWTLEASHLAPGTWETSARSAVRRACEQDKWGALAMRVWNRKGELIQVVLRARERTSADLIERAF